MARRSEDTKDRTRHLAQDDRRESRGQPPHDVFVSYSAHDKLTADAIVSRLEQARIRCWVAPRDVIPGKVFGEAIEQAIEASRLMVVVFSGETNQSHHVHREVERAVANDVVIIPFRIELAEPSGAMAYFLSSEHWLDAMTPPLDAHIAQLVKVAHMLLESAPVAAREQAPETPEAALPIPATSARGRRRWLLPVLAAAASLAVLGLAGGLLSALVFSGPAQPKAAQPRPAQPKMVAIRGLVAGDCVKTPQAYDQNASSRLHFWNTGSSWPTTMPVVPCGNSHSGEVFFSNNAWANNQAYPGDSAVLKQWSTRCASAFETYVGIPDYKSALSYTGTYPDSGSWTSGDRELICVAFNTEGQEYQGSIRGSRQ